VTLTPGAFLLLDDYQTLPHPLALSPGLRQKRGKDEVKYIPIGGGIYEKKALYNLFFCVECQIPSKAIHSIRK
jgi:hypothetical protein